MYLQTAVNEIESISVVVEIMADDGQDILDEFVVYEVDSVGTSELTEAEDKANDVNELLTFLSDNGQLNSLINLRITAETEDGSEVLEAEF